MRVKETSSIQFDNWGPPYFEGQFQLWFEYLFCQDWTVDRSTWPFKTSFIPEQYLTGRLAESWEKPDPQTITVHLRQGIYFQDKPPVNGRELTADDVVFHYDRLCGTGHGFTEPSPYGTFPRYFESATAIDKYTVTVKFKQPNAINFPYFWDLSPSNTIEAPEAVKQYGDLKDWRNAVGTGPWILTDFVNGSSLTYAKNTNYWGYDERHPQNRLPYADKLTVLCIPDLSTAMAALRTGKIDILTAADWQQAQILAKSNPELQQADIPASGYCFHCNLNNEPVSDLNVRKALQLALDLKTIAKTHFGGTIDDTPCGRIYPGLEDYAYSYDQWSQQIKDEYSYNPEEARRLLAEAGYPNGLKTSTVASTSSDLTLAKIVKSYFMDIGVDMEIITMDMATQTGIIMQAKHEALCGPERGTGVTGSPWRSQLVYMSYWVNPTTVNDPTYNAMCRSFETITDPAQLAQQIMAADKYALEQH